MLFKIKFQACGESPPPVFLQDLSGRRVPENEFCHTLALAADDEDACIIQDWRYSKEHTFQHVSGCSCFIYMNNNSRDPDTTILWGRCRTALNTTYPCFVVSTMQI
jgi:hypothetical protein